MKTLVLCDFDGTITLRDMGYALLNRFSSGDWEAIDRDYCAGRIGSREAYCRIARIIRGRKEEILQFVRDKGRIDPTFLSFYRTCRASGIDLKVVSDGLDFYIRAILEANGLSEIPFYGNAVDSFGEEGMNLSFPWFNEDCGRCGTCKREVVRKYRHAYDLIFFAGNGVSDRCGAREADFVFAKEPLFTYCVEQSIACHFFTDFQEIAEDLRKEVRGIIFDLDGTLVESNEAIYLGLCEVFQRLGRKIFPFDDLRNYLTADLQTTLAPFFTPEETREAIPILRRKYEEVYLDKTRLLDGAGEVIEGLHARGILLAVASNKHGPFTRGVIQHLGMGSLFRSVRGAGDVPKNKPFPDMLDAALGDMGLSAKSAIFAGDTLTDIETGRNAGVDVYALATGIHSREDLARGRPKRILKDLKELLEAVSAPSIGRSPAFMSGLGRRSSG